MGPDDGYVGGRKGPSRGPDGCFAGRRAPEGPDGYLAGRRRQPSFAGLLTTAT